MDGPQEGHMLGLEWRLRRQSEMATLAVRGELDLACADQLHELLDALLGEGPILVLDLEELAFMDSTGLRLLARIHERAEREGRRFLLARISAPVRRVIDIAGLSDYFDYAEGPPSVESG